MARWGAIPVSVKQRSLSGEAIEIPVLWHDLCGHETPASRGQVKLPGESECCLPKQTAETRAAAAIHQGAGRKGKLKLTHH